MNRSFTLITGILATLFASLAGLVLIPNWQFRDLEPIRNSRVQLRPSPPAGPVADGREVYIDLGCLYCHSQQVRPRGFGSDVQRGWGPRRTVARDYLYDKPHLLGTMRTGPDLSNIGVRQPGREWHYLHLFNPQIMSQGSIMPAFPFLFEQRKTGGSLPEGAVALPAPWSSEGGYLQPTPRAVSLVLYLMSLDRTYELPEAR